MKSNGDEMESVVEWDNKNCCLDCLCISNAKSATLLISETDRVPPLLSVCWLSTMNGISKKGKIALIDKNCEQV